MKRIKAKGIDILIYKPALTEKGKIEFFYSKVMDDFRKFKTQGEVIIANHMIDDLIDAVNKVDISNFFGVD